MRIVLPSSCVACDEELPLTGRKASCCLRCWQRLPRITTAVCRSCGFPSELPSDVSFVCVECGTHPSSFSSFSAWGHYRAGLEKLLVAFKFQKHDFLANHLAELLLEAIPHSSFDVVVPVPLHWRRLRSRGYNQSELLSLRIARSRQIRHSTTLLRRTRATPPQISLGRDDRAKNVRKAFLASEAVAGLNVLLVDDVCTTGATLRECAKSLLNRGAATVCAAVVARA